MGVFGVFISVSGKTAHEIRHGMSVRWAAVMSPDCSGGMGGHAYEANGMEWVRMECGHIYVPEWGLMRVVWQVHPAAGDASREARG